ncbi:hypothetical protein [Pulveribacter sp.]|uniref:hypothetical protein n=1 Tax=Pulveribacter sp. TaxID=2678893 RepID=UPI0028B04F05|nr:hypothetical protein [Pulveribacter sp.]
MRTLVLFALSTVATAAMAVSPSNHHNQAANTIMISGNSTQTTNSTGSIISNKAGTDNTARQNIASNAGPVEIHQRGSSEQTANLGNTVVNNEAAGNDALARQNLASNNGEVEIRAASKQTVNANSVTLGNLADGSGAKAVQNIASNYGHVVVAAASNQTANFSGGGGAYNTARGTHSLAVQNLSSNDACADDPCPGGRCN